MNNNNSKKLLGLVFALFITKSIFGQLNNCINTKEHPLIEEIIDSVKTKRNYNSLLAYTVIKGNKIGLSRSKVLNLAYAWAACKRIMDINQRKDEEIKYLEAILEEREFQSLKTHMGKPNLIFSNNHGAYFYQSFSGFDNLNGGFKKSER
jgi:hypothetical protein